MKSPFAPYRPWFIIGKNNGQVPLERQFAGLHTVDVKNKTVLEIGSAEGLVSFEFAKRGAKMVHGVELLARAVDVARAIAHYTPYENQTAFFVGNMLDGQKAISQSGMLPTYDVVTAMAVLQKMPHQFRVLKEVLNKCAHTFVIRLPERRAYRYRFLRTAWSFGGQDILPLIESHGFKLIWQGHGHPKGEPPYPMEGDSWMAVFERIKPI